jgi:hypothetical protein
MYAFHVTVHARPAEATPGVVIEIGGRKLATLSVPHEARSRPFEVALEDAGERLDQLDRMFSEPDGSFVWTSPHDEPAWQVDGNLFDRGGRLLFVDLKGTCPADEFDRLLAAFGWPQTPLVFQLVHEAVFIDELEFRRWAGQ